MDHECDCWSSNTKQYTSFGPCTPTTRVFSISAVLLGPVAKLIMEGRNCLYFSFRPSRPSFISYTSCEVVAMQTCMGAYTLETRPCRTQLRTMLPVLAIKYSQLVTETSQLAISLYRRFGCTRF